MLLRIVSILFPMFAIAAGGYAAGRFTRPDLSHANKLNMDVFVPALIFGALASKDFRLGEYLPLLGATTVVVVGSGLAGWALARLAGLQPKTFVPPMMFNNAGNIGLPLAVLAFGEVALAPAVVMFMVSNLAHFTFGNGLARTGADDFQDDVLVHHQAFAGRGFVGHHAQIGTAIGLVAFDSAFSKPLA